MCLAQADATERQLVCDALALFTPAALAGPAPRPRRGGGSSGRKAHAAHPLDVLMQAMALGADGGDGGSAAVVRRVALSRATAELYAAVPAEQQARLLQVRCFFPC